MEDHLKNKDRLEQEWLALCVYEAEPCATTIVLSEENKKKNRYEDVLPYDHARVVLNELSNITGSDYINASTIVSFKILYYKFHVFFPTGRWNCLYIYIFFKFTFY